jgi:hypothetical protein
MNRIWKEDKLEILDRRILKTEADLERSQEIGNVELELEIRRSLNFLFKEKERLTTGYRTETARAVSAPPPPPQLAPPPIFFYYEMYLRNVTASLASLTEVKGFRNFVKAQADRIGITGFIQRYHANDLRLGFEGSGEQCRDFLN